MNIALILKNDLSEIERLAKAVVEFGKENNLASHIIDDVRLILEEIVSNILTYGFDDESDHQVTVQIDLRGDVLVIEVKDDGNPFDPMDYCSTDVEKPFDEREIGGMGIHLVRNLVDELDYRQEQEMNTLVMKKRLTKSPS